MSNESNCDFRNCCKEARQEKILQRGARRVAMPFNMAIKSITHRGLKRFHEEGSTRGIDARYARLEIASTHRRPIRFLVTQSYGQSEIDFSLRGWRYPRP